MTIDEFRKLYKNTDDVKTLIESHVEVAELSANFNYNDRIIHHDFSKIHI